MSDRFDHHRRRNRDQDQPDEREPLRRRKVENKESSPMIPLPPERPKGPPVGATGATPMKPKAPPPGVVVPTKPKLPPPGVTVPPPRPPAPEQATSAAMRPPPSNPRGTAGKGTTQPKGKAPPPPPGLPSEDVWNNRNVSAENRDLLTTCKPEWFCVSHGLGADGRHILDWRDSVE
eukprot:190601-Amphidinium_carterae.2